MDGESVHPLRPERRPRAVRGRFELVPIPRKGRLPMLSRPVGTETRRMPAPDPNQPRHPIAVVAARTGLGQDVLRIWERRYRVVVPHRSQTGRRLYTDADVQRLNLIRLAVESGRRISDVASLPVEELRRLEGEDSRATVTVRGREPRTDAQRPAFFVEAALDAIERYDAAELDRVLRRASLDLSAPLLRSAVIEPVLVTVGERWRHGTLRIANEHLATGVIRSFLGVLHGKAEVAEGSACVVLATPAGQRHELGALLAALAALEVGWNAVYLGPDLPAAEIASAARACGARAVALSVTSPAAGERVDQEFLELRRLLGADMPIFVGGAAARGHAEGILRIGAVSLPDIHGFQDALTGLGR